MKEEKYKEIVEKGVVISSKDIPGWYSHNHWTFVVGLVIGTKNKYIMYYHPQGEYEEPFACSIFSDSVEDAVREAYEIHMKNNPDDQANS